ncbi:MAG: YicC family protein [Thermoanaerobaculales bacterium]
MTGFGRATAPLSPRLMGEVRLAAVNGRFLEVVVRMQPRLESAELESAIRVVLAEKLARGRVQVTVALQTVERSAGSVTLHWEVAEALLAALAKRPEGLELAPLTLRDLLALPGFAEGGEMALADDEQRSLLELVGRARDALVVAREGEAAALMPQIRAEAARVREFQRWLADANAQVSERLLARLRERIATLLAGAEVPQERVVQEAALAADRANVAEEVTRIGAHLDHLDRLLAAGGPTGKRIDFLLQELLREVNTAGAKCREAGMGERVVEAKAALEKLREQCANLE